MAKSEYTKPQLVEYGSIVDLTAGVGSPGQDFNTQTGQRQPDQSPGCGTQGNFICVS